MHQLHEESRAARWLLEQLLRNGNEGLPVATACIRALESPHSAGSPAFLVVREWHPACVNATEQSKPTFTSGEGAFARIAKGACLTQSGNVRSPKNDVESTS